MKKDYDKEDYNKRTTAGSGSRSGSGIAHTDPDPAKSYGSGRIRIRNTGLYALKSLLENLFEKFEIIGVRTSTVLYIVQCTRYIYCVL